MEAIGRVTLARLSVRPRQERRFSSGPFPCAMERDEWDDEEAAGEHARTPTQSQSRYDEWNEPTLREECASRGLRTSGPKPLLVERLETSDEILVGAGRSTPAPRGVKRELGSDNFALASPGAQDKAARGRSFRTTTDPIHGVMKIPLYCYEFIDTPQFQRLRYLKQLGTTSFVFQVAPLCWWLSVLKGFQGATHTRYEHSLGVAYLANMVISMIQKEQPELNITDREVRLVTVAGLCHDLGHGPFSHAFEVRSHRISPLCTRASE
jgi:hypothetical protein